MRVKKPIQNTKESMTTHIKKEQSLQQNNMKIEWIRVSAVNTNNGRRRAKQILSYIRS